MFLRGSPFLRSSCDVWSDSSEDPGRCVVPLEFSCSRRMWLDEWMVMFRSKKDDVWRGVVLSSDRMMMLNRFGKWDDDPTRRYLNLRYIKLGEIVTAACREESLI